MMYATKLMMQKQSPVITTYVEDSSLVYKVENANLTTGIKKTIKNVVNGDKAFTFCGTLGNITGHLYHIFNYRFGVSRSAKYIYLTNLTNSASVLGGLTTTPYEMSDIQPYIAVTMTCPTSTSQIITLTVEGGETYSAEVSLQGSLTDAVFRVMQAVNPIDLVLVYDRVLTNEELVQNYKAFLYNHR